MSTNSPFKILQPTPAEPPTPRPVYFDRYDGRIKVIKALGSDETVVFDFLESPRRAINIARHLNMDPVRCKDPQSCGVCHGRS